MGSPPGGISPPPPLLLTQGLWAQFLISVCLQSDHLACTKNPRQAASLSWGRHPTPTHTVHKRKKSQPQLGCPGPPGWCPMDHSGLVHPESKKAATAFAGTLWLVTFSITFNHEPTVQPHLSMNHELKVGTPIRRAFQAICSWKEWGLEGNRDRGQVEVGGPRNSLGPAGKLAAVYSGYAQASSWEFPNMHLS